MKKGPRSGLLDGQKRNSNTSKTMNPVPPKDKLLGPKASNSEPLRPLDVKSVDLKDADNNKIVIHNESGAVQSITDNMGSDDDNRYDNDRNLSEIER